MNTAESHPLYRTFGPCANGQTSLSSQGRRVLSTVTVVQHSVANELDNMEKVTESGGAFFEERVRYQIRRDCGSVTGRVIAHVHAYL